MLTTTTKCRCGHLFEEHPLVGERIYDRRSPQNPYKCEKCNCENYKDSSMLQEDGKNVNDTEERFREVLRNKYQEFCPNCERHLGVADTIINVNKFSVNCQVRCKDCFKLLIDITDNQRIKTKLQFSDMLCNINYLIETLDKFPEANVAD